MNLKPISQKLFENKIKRSQSKKINFEAYFKSYIDKINDFSIGPYFWLIPDQISMTFFSASKNIHKLTPFNDREWKGQTVQFWIENIHPEDRPFFISATYLSIQLHSTNINLNINMYLRMLNAEKEYRWVLIQYPVTYLNEEREVVSGLVIITDISHLNIHPKAMMTVMDKIKNSNQFYTLKVKNSVLINHELPKISKREREILALMAKGMNTPQMAESLFLSYHTIENHKRNLRRKTKVKTSAELIGFAFKYHILTA